MSSSKYEHKRLNKRQARSEARKSLWLLKLAERLVNSWSFEPQNLGALPGTLRPPRRLEARRGEARRGGASRPRAVPGDRPEPELRLGFWDALPRADRGPGSGRGSRDRGWGSARQRHRLRQLWRAERPHHPRQGS